MTVRYHICLPDLGDLGDGLSLGGYAVPLFCFLLFYLFLAMLFLLSCVCGKGRKIIGVYKKTWGRERGRFVEVAERVESRVLPASIRDSCPSCVLVADVVR